MHVKQTTSLTSILVAALCAASGGAFGSTSPAQPAAVQSTQGDIPTIEFEK